VLLIFNEKEDLTFDEVKQSSGIEEEELKRWRVQT
jgi:hypothetical protein